MKGKRHEGTAEAQTLRVVEVRVIISSPMIDKPLRILAPRKAGPQKKGLRLVDYIATKWWHDSDQYSNNHCS
jgi:hypothetical protein